jgi:hypothetical protein
VQVKKAYCPPQIVEKNPIVDYCKFIIFGYYSKMTVTLNGVRTVTPRPPTVGTDDACSV